MILSRSSSRLCLASPSNRAASVSALTALASCLLRAFCRCFWVMVSGCEAGVDVAVVVVVVANVCAGPDARVYRIGEPAARKKKKGIH